MPYILVDNPDWEKAAGGWGGLERIEFDFENPEEFNCTQQFDERLGKWIIFNVIVNLEKRGADEIKLSITYNEDDNRHLFENGDYTKDDFVWATHVLRLIRGDSFGSSIWDGEEGPGWKSEQIRGSRRKVTTTKLQRDQARFRAMLFSVDECCAVSGESCPTVLEAAHIVSVKDGGNEVLSNGILLRADLHRLYDADPPEFTIYPDTGDVSTSNDYGGFDFRNRVISESILFRIRDALRARK